MKKYLLLSFLITQIAQAQINIGGLPYSYSENFNGYNPNSAANFTTTIPPGWTGSCTGTYVYNGIGTGTSNTGGFWGYGTAGEISLGALRSGTAGNITYTVSFKNNSGSTITALDISYDFEQWRYANTSGFSVTQTFIGASVAGLNHDGVASGTNGTVTVTPKSITLTGLNILNSTTFTISFTTTDIAGADNGIGIDNFSLTATGLATPPCTEPTAQPTGLSLTPASHSVNGSFTASPSANGYLVVASTSATLGGAPVDGTVYTVGSTIGTGTVVAVGSSTSFTAVGLSPSTTYYFFVFAYNDGGACTINYLTTSPLTGNTTTLAPPSPTVLYPGDMIFVGYDNLANRIYNPSVAADDYLVFTNLVPINPGTKFLIANCTYETGAKPGGLVRTNNWWTCSTTPSSNVPFAEITYVGASVLPAGSIMCFISSNESNGNTITAKTSLGTLPPSNFDIAFKDASGANLGTSSFINISTSNPDAIFLMQGTFNYAVGNTTFNGRVLGAIQDGGIWYEFTDDLTSITGSNLRRSRKHPDIECFSIQGATSPAIHAAVYNFVFKNGTQHQLLSQISNFATNWVVFSSGSNNYVDWGNMGLGDVNDPNCETNACACPKEYLTVTTAAVDGQWIGTVSTDWFNCRNWDNLQVPNATVNVTIPPFPTAVNDCYVNRTSPLASKYGYVAKCNNLSVNGRILEVDQTADTLEVNGNLVINGGTLDLNDGVAMTFPDGLIQLKGNWTNNAGNANFDEGTTSRVHFIGSSTQNINAAQPENFCFVRLSNSNNLQINQITEVEAQFEFVNGKVLNNGTNYLYTSSFSPAAIIGYDDNRYVVGKLRRQVLGGQIYDFPVGTMANYQLATLDFSNAGAMTIPSIDASFSTTIGLPNPNIIEAFYHYTTMANGGVWTLEPTGGNLGGGNYKVTLNLKGSTNAASNCIVLKRPSAGNPWTNQGTAGVCTNGSVLISSRNGLTSFSEFGIAVSTVLPVEWLDFNATLLPENQVLLNWSTASEIQNSHFNIQRSFDGVNFENIGKVNGNGTTQEISQYQFKDLQPALGRNYYRLEQVDFNGSTHLSNIVEIFVQPSSAPLLVYPNPAKEYIQFVLPNTSAQLKIYDLTGKLIHERNFENQIQVNLTDFSSGYYIYKIENESLNLIGKFVKQ